MSKKDWKKHFMRMKQLANQNLGRAEKSVVLTDDLLELERRVDQIRLVCLDTTQKISACQPVQHATDMDKRRRKLPLGVLSKSMFGSAIVLGDESDSLGQTYKLCSKAQNHLADALLKYSEDVENQVLDPLQAVVERDIPVIMKLRKQLTKLTLDMDSAKTRYHSAVRQQLTSSNSSASLSQSTTTINKVDVVRQEMEDAENRVELCKDQLITEMYSFVAREGELNQALLSLLEAQTDYHRESLRSLEQYVPLLKRHIEQSVPKAVFGCPLQSHLEHTDSDISTVIEQCVMALLQNGLHEEGIFRIAASGTKVKKLRAAFDANFVDLDDYKRDIHCIAGVLKLYLRELPEPLMTYELYNEWMRLVDMSPSARQNSMWVVVDKLPKANFNNLRYLIKFLARLAEYSEVNKMTAANLAIVFAPSLLWPPPLDDPITNTGTGLQTASAHSSIIEQLISKAEWFFPGEVDFFANCKERLVMRDRRCLSICDSRTTENVSVPPTTPLSCDPYTVLSMPLFRGARQSVLASKTPISSSLLARNESWSSFSSLHSLPEPFLYMSHDGIGRSRPILEDGFISDSKQGAENGSVDAKLLNAHQTLCKKHSCGTSASDSQTNSSDDNRDNRRSPLYLEARGSTQSDGKVICDEDLNKEIKLSDGILSRSATTHAANVVMNQFMRAKTATTKTLRKLNPKLGFAVRSLGSTPGVAIEQSPSTSSGKLSRTSSLADRFKMFRQHSLDHNVSESKTNSRLARVRERSPLADPSGSLGLGIAVAAADNGLSDEHHDPSRRVLFGVSPGSDDGSGISTSGARLTIPNHTRAASCTDRVSKSENSAYLMERSRSTEPGVPSAGDQKKVLKSPCIITIPPRIATPESSSLSSESPTSLFPTLPLTISGTSELAVGFDGLPSPYSCGGTSSVFELSQTEVPKSDLLDQILPGSTEEISSKTDLGSSPLQSFQSVDLSGYMVGAQHGELSPTRQCADVDSRWSENSCISSSRSNSLTVGSEPLTDVAKSEMLKNILVDSGYRDETDDVPPLENRKELIDNCAKAREFSERCFTDEFWTVAGCNENGSVQSQHHRVVSVQSSSGN